MRLIDADNLDCKTLPKKLYPHMQAILDFIDSQTTVEERKVGKWIKSGGSFRCSECMVMPEFKDIRTLKYCPNCGVKMVGAENE